VVRVECHFLLYFIAIAWTFLHPLASITTFEPKCRGTYFDENALLPYSAPPNFADQVVARAEELHHDFLASVHAASVENGGKGFRPNGCALEDTASGACADVLGWINATLANAVGAETHVQRFVGNDQRPGRTPSVSRPTLRENVYSILHPRRAADRKEAVVVLVSLGTMNRYVPGNQGHNDVVARSPSGVALGIALVEALSKVTWLSKNIVLVAADGGADRRGWDFGMDLGAKAWLDMYMEGDEVNSRMVDIFSGEPDGAGWSPATRSAEASAFRRAGLIFSALSLDFRGGDSFGDRLGLYLQGYHGSLANMDYVNLVGKLHETRVTFSRSPVGIDDWVEANVLPRVASWHPAMSFYVSSLGTMFQFLYDLAFCPTSGGHQHFLGYSIDAFTLGPARGGAAGDEGEGAGRRRSYRTDRLARTIQRVVRSLSNLSEDFHNAFWNYVMLSTEHFVAYGEYAWVLVIGTTSLFLAAFSVVRKESLEKGASSMMFCTFGPYVAVFAAFLHGVLALLLITVVWSVPSLDKATCVALWCGAVLAGEAACHAAASSCLSCGGPARRTLPEHEWKTVKAILCAYAWMCHAPIGIINYGLALLTCLYFAPYMILVRPVGRAGEGWCTGVLHRALFFLFSPYFFLTLAWYSGGLLEWTVEHFALGTLHLRFICLVYLPMYTLVRVIKDRSPW
jgi:hypothetical protein